MTLNREEAEMVLALAREQIKRVEWGWVHRRAQPEELAALVGKLQEFLTTEGAEGAERVKKKTRKFKYAFEHAG